MMRLEGKIASLVLVISVLLMAAAACVGNSGATAPTATSTHETATAPVPNAFTTPQLVQKLRPSVVRILSEAATIDVFGEVVPSRGVGTGIIIDNEGHIITNNHVVVQPDTCDQPAQNITVTLSDGRKFPASIVGRDVPTDLAVLKIEASDLTSAVLGDSSTVQVGSDVVAIGNALDLPGGPTVTRGVVSAEDRYIEEDQCGVTIPDAIQTDAAINPGNSGGPLVNTGGDVIAVTTAAIRGRVEGVGFAISSAMAKPIIEELISKGQVERGFLGISVVSVTPSLAERFNLPVDHGVAIRQVRPDGPADRAELRAGDIIIQVAGKEIQSSGDLFQVLMQHHAGERVPIAYFRDGEKRNAEVTLEVQPRR